MDYNIQQHDVDLSVAHNDSEYSVGMMSTLLVRTIDDITSNLKIKFDNTSSREISLKAGDTFNFSDLFGTVNTGGKNPVFFKTVYITNDAASGTAELIFSRNVEIRTLLRLTSDIISSTVLSQVVTIGTSATKIPTNPLTDRINLWLLNASGVTIYLGGSGVTVAGATQGVPLADGASVTLTIASTVDLYGIVTAGTADLNILEGA